LNLTHFIYKNIRAKKARPSYLKHTRTKRMSLCIFATLATGLPQLALSGYHASTETSSLYTS